MLSPDHVPMAAPGEETPPASLLMLSASDRDSLFRSAAKLFTMLDDARLVVSDIQNRLSPALPQQTAQVVDDRLLISDADIEPLFEGLMSGDAFIYVDPKTGRRMGFARFDSYGRHPAVRWNQIVFFNEKDVLVLESKPTDLLTIRVDPPRGGSSQSANRRPIGTIVSRRPCPDATLLDKPAVNDASDTISTGLRTPTIAHPDQLVVDDSTHDPKAAASASSTLAESDVRIAADAPTQNGAEVSSRFDNTET